MKTLLEIFAASGLLFVGYAWLLERRVDFRWCRRYLALLPLLSVAIPLLQIPLWPGRKVVLAPLGEMPLPEAVAGTAPVAEPFGWAEALGLLYLVGVLLIVGLMAYQVWKIRALERGAEIDSWHGIRVVRTTSSIASFSFFGTVYVPASTPEQELPVILRHEESHIRHRHSQERLWMELCKALLWWNPFIWLAARRLTEVEEFEADRDVLLSGEDTNHYIQTIFKQLFGYSPDIANGLRDSLTKKRFKMMTQNNKSRYARLRAAALLSLVAGVVLLFGTTARATQFVEPSNPMQTPTASIPDVALSEYRGVVTDAAGSPIMGAVVRSGERGVVTDAEGRFDLQVPSGSNGEVVMVGYDRLTFQFLDDAELVLTLRKEEPETPTQQFLTVEKMPAFQGGGLPEFQRWVAENMKYPQEAVEKKISGRVLVQFVVNEEGAVTEVKALQSPHALLSNEAIRVVNSSPRWEPGVQKGEKVSVRFVLPVDFAL
ncbi:MAG: TonB family protein [Rikenellaceae bacterium]|nr:TonB family protein [Rikenellaceae bacterium]